MDASQTRERFYELDFLRFAAAIAVLLFHYVFRIWNLDGSGTLAYPLLSGFSKYGYLGVDAFFMISGFVILMSAEGRSAWEFAISRIVRLYPAYWFCTIVIFIFATFWPVENYRPGVFDFFLNLTMFHSWFGSPHVSSVFWTLVVEMQFYFIVLFIIKANLLDRLVYILSVWLSISILSDYLDFPHWAKTLIIASWCHYFIAGSIFYLIRKKGVSLYKLVLLTICLWEAVKHGYWYVLVKEKLSGVDYTPEVVIVFLGVLFLFFFIVSLRKLPYPLYLIHAMIGETLLIYYIGHVNKYVLFLAITLVMIVASYIIHRYVELNAAHILKKTLLKI